MTKTQTQFSPQTLRRVVLITAILLILFGAYLLAFLVPDVIRTLPGPETMTLARAAEVAGDDSRYATIEDGQWDCDTITYIRGRETRPANTGVPRIITRYTEIFLTDATSRPETVMLVQMSGEMDCGDFDGVIPTGYLTRLNSDQQSDLGPRLAGFIRAENFLAFCGYCGTDNSLIGVVFGVVLAVAGLALLIFGLRMPKGEAAEAVSLGDDLIS